MTEEWGRAGEAPGNAREDRLDSSRSFGVKYFVD